MQVSQEATRAFRRRRLLIAVVVAVLVLIFTLGFLFVEERNRIEQQSRNFADKTIQRFERLFSPLDVTANSTLSLIGRPCDEVRIPLVKKLAALQTVRAIILVENDQLYCSSIFGRSNISFSGTYPELAVNKQLMLLTTDKRLLKGSPVLLLWTPDDFDNQKGILLVINIEMISNYLLEPTLSWVERAVLSVGENSLEYGNPLIEHALPSEAEVNYQEASLRYPFTITLFGPHPTRLALMALPAQLPLALLLSLLIGYSVWLATANRISLAWQIHNGITAREFLVYCQPLINARSGDCEGVELLLRWHSARQGWVPPDLFIPLAESNNLIASLTRYVLGEVVQALPYLPATPDFHIAINVASSHFHQRQIMLDIQQLWWPANPRPQLVVELTERDALPEVDRRVVAQLRQAGVKLAIDDFGTGHSSLSYLKTLNPDILKIDKTFTAAIGTDAINATVTDMVISLAQKLNISLVAEGVETEAQAAYLREKGVDVLQGYFFAPPIPLADFAPWFREHQQSLSVQNGKNPC